MMLHVYYTCSGQAREGERVSRLASPPGRPAACLAVSAVGMTASLTSLIQNLLVTCAMVPRGEMEVSCFK